MAQPGFPNIGDFFRNPVQSGVTMWTQKPGSFVVYPMAPRIYPPRYEGYPQSPFAYEGLYSLICAHWTNTIEVYKQWDPYTEVLAAILVCPVCSVIQAIVEPADQWWEQWYGLYNTGLEIATLPTAVE